MDSNKSHLIARAGTDYKTWPLWAQILLPLASITLWVPLYFFLQRIAKSKFWRKREGHATDLESQSSLPIVLKGDAVGRRS